MVFLDVLFFIWWSYFSLPLLRFHGASKGTLSWLWSTYESLTEPPSSKEPKPGRVLQPPFVAHDISRSLYKFNLQLLVQPDRQGEWRSNWPIASKRWSSLWWVSFDSSNFVSVRPCSFYFADWYLRCLTFQIATPTASGSQDKKSQVVTWICSIKLTLSWLPTASRHRHLQRWFWALRLQSQL